MAVYTANTKPNNNLGDFSQYTAYELFSIRRAQAAGPEFYRRANNASPSLPAASHVVDEGTIDIGTAATDGIEERIRVCDKILFVRELVRNDLGIADITEHHQPTRHSDRFSPCTCSHEAYTDPF